MKNIKKLMAIALVAMMFAVMTVPAMAEGETVSITISKAIDGATYSAYKLLDANVGLKQDLNCGHSSDAEHESSCYNVSYSFNPTFEDILKSYTNASTLEDVIAMITTYTTAEAMSAFTHHLYTAIANGNIQPDLTGTGAGGSVTLPVGPGYWLVIESAPDSYNGATSRIIVDTAGSRNVSIEAKRQEPTLKKEVHDNNLYHQQGSDVQIGDTVDFLLTALIPDPVGYSQYKYIIHDSMEKGLTFNKGSVEIEIGQFGSNAVLNQADYYTVTENVGNDGTTFSIDIDIKKAISDGALRPQDKIYISYTTVLNKDAEIYDKAFKSLDNANKNTAYLEYSSNPYDLSKTAKTQEDSAYVWTFPLTINKVDADGKSIKGAKFVLSTDYNLKPSLNADGTPADTNGLMGFIKSGDTYRVAPAGTASPVYVLDMSETSTINLEGFNDQIFYYLYEVAAPDGYNKLTGPVTFKFFASYDGTSAYYAEGSPYVNVAMPGLTGTDSAELEANIVNRTGKELPSTGGIGTTIFYVLGGFLAAGAVVFLITNKRVDDKR